MGPTLGLCSRLDDPVWRRHVVARSAVKKPRLTVDELAALRRSKAT
jgi:hypothetical protein